MENVPYNIQVRFRKGGGWKMCPSELLSVRTAPQRLREGQRERKGDTCVCVCVSVVIIISYYTALYVKYLF